VGGGNRLLGLGTFAASAGVGDATGMEVSSAN
jgi:hypothetical protein